MAFLGCAIGIAQHPGQQAQGGVKHRLGGNLAPRQHKITKADFGYVEMIKHPLIDPFEPATQQDQPGMLGPGAGGCLAKAGAAGREVIDRRAGGVAALRRL